MAGHARLEFDVQAEALGATTVRLAALELVEGLDEPYRGALTLEVLDPDADVTQLLGTDLVVTLTRGGVTRRICGLVKTVWEAVDHHGEDHVTALIELRPALDLLSLRRNTRMFQEMSVPDIVKDVLEAGLAPYGREVRLELNATYPVREYCMQYQESDLAFVERLLSEEGIFTFFDHEGDVEVLVLADANAAFADVPGGPALSFSSDMRDLDDEHAIDRFVRRHDHTTTSVVVRDFDWTAASPIVEDEERSEDARGRDRESYEHGLGRGVGFGDYDAGARAYRARDEAAQKVLRLEAHRRGALEAEGQSRAIGLAPATRFELTSHPIVGMDGEYYVTRARHVLSPRDEDAGGDAHRTFFECRPMAVAHRPRWTGRKPTIPSVQTAIVTGPSGEEIHTDEHGRVKVQFPWDRENPADETSSCWVRCEQAWAGAGWGFWWVPRIGMEVVVHFVEGDPDRPVVTGCVYNAVNPPPYTLPDEKTKSTIKSNSSPGGGGFNELRFEDAAGAEQIYVHAQKDYDEVVLHDHTTTVHHDQSNTVDNDQTQLVEGNQTETVHQNQVMTVGGNRTVHVKGDFEETVDGTETRTTTGDVSETFDANETRDVASAVSEAIGGDETRTIGGNQTETVGASHTFDVGASSARVVGGNITSSIGANLTETAPGGYTAIAAGSMDVTVGGATTWTAPAGAKIIAPGGVKWIDYKNDWLGLLAVDLSLSVSAKTYGLKLEYGAWAFGLAGLKCEQAAVTVTNASQYSRDCLTLIETSGGKVSTGAFKKWAYGLLGFGG